MASTAQRQAAARQARKQAKSTQQVVRDFAVELGYSQADQVYVAQHGTQTIDFTDIDRGYEDFIKALRSIGFEWEYFKTHSGKAIIHFIFSETKAPITQAAGDFPASLTCENGEPLEEFAVAAGFYTIIEQSLKYLQSQVSKKLCVPMMRYSNGTLQFHVMPV
jgi:hypothetical protein